MIQINKLPPFKSMCCTIGNLPTSFMESMTYYEALEWLYKYLADTIIPTINNTGDAVIELQAAFTTLENYVNNYFENLDVQQEINNKLDDMAESGQLTDIIAQYLGLAGILTFNSVDDMKLAENLTNGSTCQTCGFYNVNDGGTALYKVRPITNDDTVDNMFIIALHDNLLIAELVTTKEINVLKLGIKKDGTTDNSTLLQHAIDTIEDGTLYFPKGKYIFNTNIDCANKHINFKGDFDYVYTGVSTVGLCFNDVSGFINTGRVFFDKLIIQNENLTHEGDGIKVSGGTRISNCCIIGFANAIHGNYHSIVAENNNIHYNNNGIYRTIDSRIINNTINANENDGILLDTGCNDNIVSNNKIEWNKRNGVTIYSSTNNVISNNIIDRSTQYGITINAANKNLISSNFLRRNNINTAINTSNSQIRIENSYNITLENNQLKKGNSNDDGSGDEIPVYALYITYSHDILSMGNDYQNSCTESDPIKQYQNSGNIQFFDLGFNIPDLLTAGHVQGKITDGTLTLEVDGTPSNSAGYCEIDKFNYFIRKSDLSFYEAGTLELSNFPLNGNNSSTSAKCNKSTIGNGDINISVTFNRTTAKYSVTFTSATSPSIRLEKILI